MYFIIIVIVISLFIGSITYFIIEATNIKNRDKKVVGGCQTTLYGCCPNGTTPKKKDGSNC
jgi:hypothetical protein